MPKEIPSIQEKGLQTAGQRRVNLLWEVTQTAIAAIVVSTSMVVSAKIALLVTSPEVTEKVTSMAITAFVLISNSAFLVIGFYFGRTNHQKVGGVGPDEAGR